MGQTFQTSQQQSQNNANQESSEQNQPEQEHSDRNDSGLENSGQNQAEAQQDLKVDQQQSHIDSGYQPMDQGISDQSYSDQADSMQGTVDFECTLHEEPLASPIVQEQHEIDDHGYLVCIPNQTSENNETSKGLDCSNQNQSDVEQELTTFQTNQHQPQIDSNQQHINSEIPIISHSEQEHSDHGDSGNEDSDQNQSKN